MDELLRHAWTPGLNYLTGIGAADWWRLLRANGFAVDPVYGMRALLITLFSLTNSLEAWGERRRYGAKVASTAVSKPPVFILGHWRGGTTHLHNLLAQDDEQLTFPSTYQVMNPHAFLTAERRFKRLWSWAFPSRRPMDNMAISLQTPQEDEWALCLIAFRSYYLSFSFPEREPYYARYLTFRGVAQEEVEEWKAALVWFVKKLTLVADRSVVLKSPPHTCRIRLLLECFPDARFIHVHRHPHLVFCSTRHLLKTLLPYTTLQRPPSGARDDMILNRYNTMYDAFFEELDLIPSGRFHELPFEALERDPVGQVELIYDRLGISGFARARPKLVRYLESIAGYRKNELPELTLAESERVAACWSRSFEAWGYDR